jgi:hypothetical protein
VNDLTQQLLVIYNGRLKVFRLCDELLQLAKQGVSLPANMQGLTDDQIRELKLVDDWAERCTPSGGYEEVVDPLGRRGGRAPLENMRQILERCSKEARALLSKDRAAQEYCMKQDDVEEALRLITGAVTIVYPMGLPPHDPIRQELQNEEDLAGTQASLEVIPENEAVLWFCGKEMTRGKVLSDFVGKNEKTKVVIKLSKKSQGPPAREPVVSQQEQREMMAYYYRKQEDMKKLEQASREDDSGLNSEWADGEQLKRQFHGLRNIQWGPR